MKNFLLSSIALIILSLTLTGCFKKDTMEGIEIYTTIYPIEYITEVLYGEHAKIFSIYPNNIDINNYRLTEKQISDYSKGGLYIYNGLSNEKDYAIGMLNENRNLKIIDGAMNMEYTNSIEEIWLDPSNFLMLAQNIRKGFEEYITNPYLKNEIINKYDNLKIELSEIDAELKVVAENAKNRNLVVSSDLFLFLKKYNFNVISLQEESLSARKKADVEKLINDGVVNSIIVKPNEELNDTIKELINKHDLEILIFNTATNLSEQERYERVNFIDIMNQNIDLLKREVYQ